MKRLVCLLLLVCLVLTGCASPVEKTPEKKQYTASFLDVFDTVTSMAGKAENEEVFRTTTQKIHDELMQYHQLFDIYKDYAGINNLKTINDNAGIAPVTVDPRIIDLLKDCKTYYELISNHSNMLKFHLLYDAHKANAEMQEVNQ